MTPREAGLPLVIARRLRHLGRIVLLLGLAATARAQTPPAPSPPAQSSPDSWAAIAFLEGTWTATTQGGQGAAAVGHYTFRRELGGHVLARHSASAACKGPDDFDCDHGDLLYVFQDAPGAAPRAIYFDNEGHVLHYLVTTPVANRAVFLSEPAPGPRFRLTYERDGTTMTGRFQIQAPGQEAWTSYLEWTGARE